MKKEFWYEILMNIGILVFGILLTMYADKITNIVSITIGILAILYAVGGFVKYFKNSERKVSDNIELVYAITMLVVGGILIFRVDFLKNLVSFVAGIYILISSFMKLNESIQIGKKIENKLTGSIILSCIGVFIGLMCIVGKFLLPDMIIKYVGILLIVYGIINIINFIMLRRNK